MNKIYEVIRTKYPGIPDELLKPDTRIVDLLPYTGGKFEDIVLQEGDNPKAVQEFLEKRLKDINPN